MRIIGGKNKGKKLKSFDGQDIRPTSDRARESLFNILGSRVFGCDFLDLCSGTGGVGLESYSRGANTVTFVDSSQKSLNLAKENAKSIGLDKEFVLTPADNFLKRTDKKFDIIFFDPPYVFDGVSEILKIVNEKQILKEGGLFIYERVADKQSQEVLGFELIQSRKYGIAVFDFYRTLEE